LLLLYYKRQTLTKKWMPGEVMQKQKSINLKKLSYLGRLVKKFSENREFITG